MISGGLHFVRACGVASLPPQEKNKKIFVSERRGNRLNGHFSRFCKNFFFFAQGGVRGFSGFFWPFFRILGVKFGQGGRISSTKRRFEVPRTAKFTIYIHKRTAHICRTIHFPRFFPLGRSSGVRRAPGDGGGRGGGRFWREKIFLRRAKYSLRPII